MTFYFTYTLPTIVSNSRIGESKMRALKILAIGLIVLVGIGLGLWFSGGDSDFDEITHAQQQIGIELDSQLVEVGDINLHVVFAGPEDGEPVILIHGFPEFWYMWRHHMAALAKASYRVAALDMRGYNRTDKPAGRAAYDFSDYAGDITGLMDAQGWESANIVGHDIGARVSWQLVFDNPSRLKRAVIFSVGHPLAFQTTTKKSDVGWYRTFFRLPVLPELLGRTLGPSMLADSMTGSSRAGTFTEAEIDVYKASWDREHAFDTMLGAYRNDDVNDATIPKDGRTQMPVLFMYGAQDKFITVDVAERTKTYLGEDNVKIYPDLSHWMLAEEPEMTSAEIIGFFEKSVD
jgi:pimeloyl-ACP methyl ester carboxylesterase